MGAHAKTVTPFEATNSKTAKTSGEQSNDPVSSYMRKIAKVKLLTRGGEVEIAKRIAEGKHLLRRRIRGQWLPVEALDLREDVQLPGDQGQYEQNQHQNTVAQASFPCPFLAGQARPGPDEISRHQGKEKDVFDTNQAG